MAAMTDRVQDGSLRSHRVLLKDSLWARAAAAGGHIATRLLVWIDRARERHALLGLSDVQLHDIGISRADAAGEGDKPFWRA